MRMAQTVAAKQLQTQRADPRQIMASEVLAWTQAELEMAVERALAENPALECDESSGDVTPDTAFRLSPPSDLPLLPRDRVLRDEEFDPWDRVAGGVTLRDHLRTQLGQGITAPALRPVVHYLIECVDERGYFVADVAEVADKLGTSTARVESALRELQRMEPAGVGATSLRECLLLQCEALRESGEMRSPLPMLLLTLCWDDLVAHRELRIAQKLERSRSEVQDAICFLQHHLIPYPAAGFRPEHGANAVSVPSVRPDVVFSVTPGGIHVELARHHADLRLAPQWEQLAAPDAPSDTSDIAQYAREQVEQARMFINCLVRRGRTLGRLARALAEAQGGFIQTGDRAFLRPLTRQTLADALKMDESVVSRAIADKWAQIGTGEIVPLDAFFGTAQAVREALVRLVAGENTRNPYSDDEIALLLTEQGFPLARRTVAKYRSLERILPTRLRKREG